MDAGQGCSIQNYVSRKASNPFPIEDVVNVAKISISLLLIPIPIPRILECSSSIPISTVYIQIQFPSIQEV